MQILTDLSSFPLWRLILSAGFLTLIPIPSAWIGGRLNRSRPQYAIGRWIREIGSDIRWFGTGVGLTLSVSTLVGHWKDPLPYAIPLVKLQLVIFALLASIAAISVGSHSLEVAIESNKALDDADKRNYLTLIPLAASVAKLGLYVISFMAGLGSLGIDIAPLIQASALVGVIVGLAVQTTLQDLFATLFLFTDRVLYVGDSIRYTENGADFHGRVVRITAMRVFIESDAGETLILSNRKLDRVVRVGSHLSSIKTPPLA